jgi:hypothetical protein
MVMTGGWLMKTRENPQDPQRFTSLHPGIPGTIGLKVNVLQGGTHLLRCSACPGL